eukprot:TRINITY_DN72_c0_g1_i1.p1 TRINITY_DN72_c0_g1~~TRINITY_DN72_c0_g1_i1.p1  ORF type:complete len:454 (-),score=58.54 TRINITY_DN72_c0_g1_i1:121-1482(-)
MVLTEKQRTELHKAILEYLRMNGFEKAYQQLQEDTKIPESEIPFDNSLEKKWVSIIRLQKKIDDLQSRLDQAKEESGALGKLKLLGKDVASDHLPQAPEKMLLEGHRGQVTRVLFHPVYSLLVSASEDATIKVWDMETGKPEKSLKGHTGTVNHLAFNATGTMLASCSSDITVKLWNFQTFECIKTLHGHEHNVTGVAFLSSGDHIVSASRDKTIKLWEVSSGFCVRTFTGHDEWVRKVVVHPTQPLMISCSQDQTAILWDLTDAATSGQAKGSLAANPTKIILQQLSGHENVIETVAFSNENAGRVIEKSEYYNKAMYAASLTVNGEEEKSETKLSLEKLKKKTKEPAKLFIATGARDKLIKLWDAKEGRLVSTFIGHDNWVREVLFHPNGKYLLSVSDDKSVRVWDLTTGRCIKKITDAHGHFVSCLDLSEKYLICATGSVDNTIKLWDCN